MYQQQEEQDAVVIIPSLISRRKKGEKEEEEKHQNHYHNNKSDKQPKLEGAGRKPISQFNCPTKSQQELTVLRAREMERRREKKKKLIYFEVNSAFKQIVY